MCFPPASRPGATASPGEICAQSLLVDLPVAVLLAVEEHNRETVPELGPQFGVVSGGFVDIDAGDLHPEVRTQCFENGARRSATTAPRANQERHLVCRYRGSGRAGVSIAHDLHCAAWAPETNVTPGQHLNAEP